MCRLYTQNIDGLDFQLGLPDEKLVNFHGCLAKVNCEFCKAPYDEEEFISEVRTKIKNIYDPDDAEAPKESSNILCKKCNRAGVKPNTVLFGRSIPAVVWESIESDFPNQVDLILVFGTSLVVSPANTLVRMVNPGVPRVLVNREAVGAEVGLDFSGSGSDAFLEGDCDAGALIMATELGWLDDLIKYKHLMCPASAEALDAALAREGATKDGASADPADVAVVSTTASVFRVEQVEAEGDLKP